MSASDIANIYASINNLQNQFDAIIGNTLSNYNQLSRIVSQQSNIYNTVYYGLGNLTTGNLNVNGSYSINGNLSLPSGNLLISNGNLGLKTQTPLATLDISGNARISGNVNIDNGLLWTDPTNNHVGINNTNPQYELDVKGDANITGSITANNLLGVNQTWQQPTRASNTNYTNNTGRPIMVVINKSGNGVAYIIVDGLNVIRYNANNNDFPLTVIIPNGSTYSFTGIITSWFELR